MPKPPAKPKPNLGDYQPLLAPASRLHTNLRDLFANYRNDNAPAVKRNLNQVIKSAAQLLEVQEQRKDK